MTCMILLLVVAIDHIFWHCGIVKYGIPHWNNLEEWPTCSSDKITWITYSDTQWGGTDKFPKDSHCAKAISKSGLWLKLYDFSTTVAVQ